MPQTKNSEPPPEVMTWKKATPVLIGAVVFDLMRIFFEFFWFFGPALAALWCTVKATDVAGVAGTYVGGALCGSAAVAAGIVGAVAIETFGIVMAMAVGFAGWLVIGGWLMKTNPRIFKENALWFAGSLLVSEIPFVGAIPAITIIVWKMHRTQIKIEEAAYTKWEKENADAQQEAANDAVYEQAQAANEERYTEEEIPEEVRKAA